ncbi:MAG: hypothetical protein JWP75_3687 [Frondihabitans sp.]|nr:hypothetical protein [Frondihabitans sp.]
MTDTEDDWLAIAQFGTLGQRARLAGMTDTSLDIQRLLARDQERIIRIALLSSTRHLPREIVSEIEALEPVDPEEGDQVWSLIGSQVNASLSIKLRMPLREIEDDGLELAIQELECSDSTAQQLRDAWLQDLRSGVGQFTLEEILRDLGE